MDGSTDSNITELIWFLLLDSKGTALVKFLSLEKVKHAHADGFKASILEATERLKLANLIFDLMFLDLLTPIKVKLDITARGT